MTDLSAVRALVQARTGLDLAAPGSSFEAVASARLRARGIAEGAAYARLLAEDAGGWGALVGALVVPETWFFRGGADLFGYLARHVGELVASRASAWPVRLLSLPCSTGEEAYSLAIALLDAGVHPSGWRVEGVDLSQRHIEA